MLARRQNNTPPQNVRPQVWIRFRPRWPFWADLTACLRENPAARIPRKQAGLGASNCPRIRGQSLREPELLGWKLWQGRVHHFMGQDPAVAYGGVAGVLPGKSGSRLHSIPRSYRGWRCRGRARQAGAAVPRKAPEMRRNRTRRILDPAEDHVLPLRALFGTTATSICPLPT